MMCQQCCCKKKALCVAGIVFLLVALVHLYRIFYPFSIMVEGHAVPHEASIIGAIVFGLLSMWMFLTGCKSSKSGNGEGCCRK